MNKNVDAAIAAISVLALAGPGRWSVLNPKKTSMEPRDATVIAYPPFESTALFRISDNHHFSEKTGHPSPFIYTGQIIISSGI
jgi:hypothetical protein